MKSLLAGAGLAVLVVAMVVVLVATDVLDFRESNEPPERVLVIGTAPDDQGVRVAAFAFVLDRGSKATTVLDTMQPATVANSSATNAREAYPFTGGRGVAEVLAGQTDGAALPWIVLSESAWARAVSQGGGVLVRLPRALSVYQDGTLVVLEPGERSLSATETAALFAGLSSLENQGQRQAVTEQVSLGVASSLAASPSLLATVVADKTATTSLTNEQLELFSAAP